MASKTVVVLGCGIGGLVAARRLRRRLGDHDRVVVVERESVYRFPPSFLWVMSGARRPEQITRDLRRQRRHGIELLTADVLEIDADHRRVKTSEDELAYDRLLVALGAELAPAAVPGFSEGAHDVYTIDGAAAARDALHRFDGEKVAVMVSRLPYKCPAAPYETAFLAEALLRRRGRRKTSRMDVYTPEPFPMPTAGPVLGEALELMLRERGIGFHPDSTVERIDPENGRLHFADGTEADYDLLLGVPAHQAPEVVQHSALAGATGFVPVDGTTLATGVDGVFAIGDVTAIPIAGGKLLPKAGVFAHREADVVAHRITDELSGRSPTATFDGSGACFVELGDGRAAYATGVFYGDDGPSIQLRQPARRWHLAKLAFEQYWLRRWF